MNRQSTPATLARDELEESRRRQLIEVTIDSLAELGYVGSTLAQIASRAGVSPGLVAHYFADKDGLLAASFRTLARRVGQRVRARLALAATARGRIFIENTLERVEAISPSAVRPELARAAKVATEAKLFDFARTDG